MNKKYDFKSIEDRVFKFWTDNPDIIKKSIELDSTKPLFSFLEGPPTANAPPALHHVECRVFKDLYNRYKFMQGFSVPRKGGWDCHGLPVEVQVEKRLKLETKKDVVSFGVENFINECKADVFRFIKDWDYLTDKLAFWLDLENPYKTLDTPYMESIWWSLKEMFKKDLLFKGYKVVPYCPRCETPLSSHEVALGYKDVEEDTVAVKFKLKDMDNTYLLAWTTTPWTLMSNMCIAINKELSYSFVKKDGDIIILASDLVEQYFETPEIVKEVKGGELVGLEYEPLFKHFKDKINPNKKAWIVVSEDYVTTEEGTGIVHQAPAFGEVDYESCQCHGVDFVNPVSKDGSFNEEISEYNGKFVKDCDQDIIRRLKENNTLLATKKYVHSYPFCWRCKSPLLYYAMDSWFIGVSRFRERMVALNQDIFWAPDHIKDGRFGNWIAGAKDWALSRNKFWGTPLPIWVCDSEECSHMEAIGSIEELAKKSIGNVMVDDLHIPTVDPIKLPCNSCGGQMSRTPEVIDCWYDSGSAPFAQYHYPFENKEMFEQSHPYGFIAEAIDQTRGWFYTMHVISTILFDKPAYHSCAVAGLLCDDNGEKMSKSKGNIVKPLEVFDEVGVDAVRLLMCSYSLGDNVRFGKSQLNENVLPFINILWNSYYFSTSFMKRFNLSGNEVDMSSIALEDKWILSKTNSLVNEVTEFMELHKYSHAVTAISQFVTEDFSRVYIKYIRERTNNADDAVAYVFKYVIDRVMRLLAPFTPYLSESIYQEFIRSDDKEISIHLMPWPAVNKDLINEDMEASMDGCKELITAILQARDKAQIGRRWPLSEVVIVASDDTAEKVIGVLGDLIKEQTNIKSVTLQESFDKISYTMKPHYRNIGDDYGQATGDVLTKLKSFDEQDIIKQVLDKGSFDFEVEAEIEKKAQQVSVKLEQKHIILTKHVQEPYSGADFSLGALYLNTELTQELKDEGYAREVIRRIQQLRKESDLIKTQKIDLFVCSDMDLNDRLKSLLAAAKDKVGAQSLTISTKMPVEGSYSYMKIDKVRSKEFTIMFNVVDV